MKAIVKKQSVVERPSWKALESHYQEVSKLHLRNLFAEDSKRGERMTAEAVGLYLDYSKNRITDKTLELLFRLAEESGLQSRIDASIRDCSPDSSASRKRSSKVLSVMRFLE